MAFLNDFFHALIVGRLRNTEPSGDSPSTPPLNQSLINEFISLSRSGEPVEISEVLRLFRDTNTNITPLKPDSRTKKEVSDAAVTLLCGKLDAAAPVELASKSNDHPYPYVRLFDTNQATQATPEYTAIFENLVKSTDRVNHPAGLSSLTFAFANLISLCTSYPNSEDVRYNNNPGFLDLSPLYGLTADDNQLVRAYEKGRGLLYPDAFFELGERILFVPRATSVLLVLLSRNHNYIARRLLQENEHGRWVLDPVTLDPAARREQDDQIFQLARRINCGTFRNIVANDFLKGLLGFGIHEYSPAIDLFSDVKPEELERYRVSVECTLLYNWNSFLSEEDVKYIGDLLMEHTEGDLDDITLDQLNEALHNFVDMAHTSRDNRPCVGLVRDDTGRFDDAELADVLQSGVEEPAAACRANGTDVRVRVLELAAMERARAWGVCSLNEFRGFLGLPAYVSFEEWASTTEAASVAQELYGDINKLELYAGLRGEKTVGGAGFCLGQTTTQGIIADVVRHIRSDPNFNKDFTPAALTTWGYNELVPNPNNGAFGACLPKLLLRNLPNNYTYNSVYGLFPFSTPDACRDALSGAGADNGVNYEFGRPVPRPIKTVDNLDAIRVVLSDPTKFASPYGDDLKRLTGGYGYLLGFDDKDAHDRDEWLTLTSLIPDAGALGRYANFYRETAERLIREKSKKVDDTRYQVDVVQDVINAVSACWAAERICGIPLDTARGYTPKEVFQMLLDLNNYIFGNVEPQDYLALRNKAADATKAIMGCIERNLGLVGTDPKSESSVDRLRSLFNEVYKEEPPESNDSHDFLARLHVSGRDTKELSANALGLAVLSSVSYAQTCAAAVRFYLDDARAKERDILRDLAKEGPEVNQKIMGYIREAQRLDPQIPVLYREVATDHVLQVAGRGPQEFKRGDRVCADFKKTHAVPSDIDPDRNTRFLQGAGFHRCIGIPFVEKTMPEVFQEIFRLEDIHCLGSSFSNIRIRTQCSNARHIRPWQTYTMLPGPDNRTTPFIYSVHDAHPRKLSFVDIDERDMRFKVFVDGKLKQVSTDFELNKSLYCGQNLNQCIELGFSKGSVIVPSGKHTVKVEWTGKDFLPGTNLIDWGDNRSRRFMWKQDSC